MRKQTQKGKDDAAMISAGQLATLLEYFKNNSSLPETITVPTSDGLEFIRINQIIRLEADSSYTTFFLTGNAKFKVAKTLKEMEELLPGKLFYRAHHSHVVNVDFVRRFQKSDGGMLVMEDKSCVPVSRQRKDELVAFLKNR